MNSIYSRVEFGPAGEIRGQMFAADEPQVIRTLEILLDGQVCAATICDLPGVNGGNNGFDITLPLGQMRFAATARLGLRDQATGQAIEKPRPIPDAWRARQLSDPTIVGFVEKVTDEGRITGWVWAPAAPRERLIVTVMLDDQPVLTTIASFERIDIRDAGIGDGKYAFDCTLPWDKIAHQRVVNISVRATPMLVPFGKTHVLRREQGAKIEERLIAAEAELKRVRAECVDLRRRLDHAGAGASAALFETVGAFFSEFAAGVTKGEMPVLASRNGTSLADLAARFPGLDLAAPPADPVARILIPAVGSIDAVVGCIEALARSGADRRAEIMLFDPGTIETAALLPALLRHLRYLRLLPGEDLGRLRNDALQTSAPALILLAPSARVQGGWLDLLLDALDQAPDVAAVGAGLLRDDGMFHSTGLLLGGGAGRMIDIGAGSSPTVAGARVRRDCDALGFGCVAIKSRVLSKLGGFDPAFADWCAALLNFSLTARQENYRVVTEPAAKVEFLDLPDQPLWVRRNFGSANPPMPQLRLRWKKSIQAADAEKRGLDRGYKAHMLVVGENPHIELLLSLGMRISLLNDQEHEEMRRRGVEIIQDATDSTATIAWLTDPTKLAALRAQLPNVKLWCGPSWRQEAGLQAEDVVWAKDEVDRKSLMKKFSGGKAIKIISAQAIEAALKEG